MTDGSKFYTCDADCWLPPLSNPLDNVGSLAVYQVAYSDEHGIVTGLGTKTAQGKTVICRGPERK
jgi:hypothetical protein